MTSKTRAKLRGLASAEASVFQIGKDGLSDAVASAVDDALKARELVKITVLKTAEEPETILKELAKKLRAEPVTVIGNKIVLYRRSEEKGVKHIEL